MREYLFDRLCKAGYFSAKYQSSRLDDGIVACRAIIVALHRATNETKYRIISDDHKFLLKILSGYNHQTKSILPVVSQLLDEIGVY